MEFCVYMFSCASLCGDNEMEKAGSFMDINLVIRARK